jgi:hypothetical protein
MAVQPVADMFDSPLRSSTMLQRIHTAEIGTADVAVSVSLFKDQIILALIGAEFPCTDEQAQFQGHVEARQFSAG